MATRDLCNNIHPVRAIAPGAAVIDNTPFVSAIIDTKGYESLTFLIAAGSLADHLDAGVAFEGDGEVGERRHGQDHHPARVGADDGDDAVGRRDDRSLDGEPTVGWFLDFDILPRSCPVWAFVRV